MSLRHRVYIAGPMSLGDRINNLATALKTYRTLLAAGFAPMCPQLTFFAEPFIKQKHHEWLEADLPWVKVSDAVLRLPGPSAGADIEESFARSEKIPVFERIEDLFQHFGVYDRE